MSSWTYAWLKTRLEYKHCFAKEAQGWPSCITKGLHIFFKVVGSHLFKKYLMLKVAGILFTYTTFPFYRARLMFSLVFQNYVMKMCFMEFSSTAKLMYFMSLFQFHSPYILGDYC